MTEFESRALKYFFSENMKYEMWNEKYNVKSIILYYVKTQFIV